MQAEGDYGLVIIAGFSILWPAAVGLNHSHKGANRGALPILART